MEIDILVTNDTIAIPVEVKSTMTVEDIKNYIERMQEIKMFFPKLAEYRIMGAIAAIVYQENTIEFAHKQGLFVIIQSGEAVVLENSTDFVPKIW